MTTRWITADEAKALLDAATPGPWDDERIGRGGDGRACSHEHQICNREGVAVAIVTHDGSPGARANDRMIAATPDLAASIIMQQKRYDEAIETLAETARDVVKMRDQRDAQRAAIRKFLGVIDRLAVRDDASHAARAEYTEALEGLRLAAGARDVEPVEGGR